MFTRIANAVTQGAENVMAMFRKPESGGADPAGDQKLQVKDISSPQKLNLPEWPLLPPRVPPVWPATKPGGPRDQPQTGQKKGHGSAPPPPANVPAGDVSAAATPLR